MLWIERLLIHENNSFEPFVGPLLNLKHIFSIISIHRTIIINFKYCYIFIKSNTIWQANKSTCTKSITISRIRKLIRICILVNLTAPNKEINKSNGLSTLSSHNVISLTLQKCSTSLEEKVNLSCFGQLPSSFTCFLVLLRYFISGLRVRLLDVDGVLILSLDNPFDFHAVTLLVLATTLNIYRMGEILHNSEFYHLQNDSYQLNNLIKHL